MSVEYESPKVIDRLIKSAEETTGESYSTLTDAHQALKNGYGQGGGTGESKPEQQKTVDITENGTTEILPDEGKVLSKVTVNVDVEIGEGQGGTAQSPPYANTSLITNYTSFFENGLRSEIIGQVDTSNALSLERMYYGCGSLTEIPSMNTSKCTNFTSAFENCNNLKNTPTIDTSNGEILTAMFRQCSVLETPPNIDTGKATSLSQVFYRCLALSGDVYLDTKSCTDISNAFTACQMIRKIHFTDTSNVTSWGATFNSCIRLDTITNIDMSYGGYSATTFNSCGELKNVTFNKVKIKDNNFNLSFASKLTAESLLNLIEALDDNTGETQYTIKLGTANLAKLTDEQKQKITEKNIKYS